MSRFFYNAFEAGINENDSLEMLYCDYYKNSHVFKVFYLPIGE